MSKGKRGFHTIGYQGRTLDEFVSALLAVGIRQLVDVRALPLSRRKGFSKTPLRLALAEKGIGYVHLRSAGNPFRGGAEGSASILTLYRHHLANSPQVIAEVEEAVRATRSVLMCMEHDHQECHRSVIADALVERGLAVTHL
jgi:uncharacterized protein (DUF488 family)